MPQIVTSSRYVGLIVESVLKSVPEIIAREATRQHTLVPYHTVNGRIPFPFILVPLSLHSFGRALSIWRDDFPKGSNNYSSQGCGRALERRRRNHEPLAFSRSIKGHAQGIIARGVLWFPNQRTSSSFSPLRGGYVWVRCHELNELPNRCTLKPEHSLPEQKTLSNLFLLLLLGLDWNLNRSESIQARKP